MSKSVHERLHELQQLAQAHGGECLSPEYFGADVKLPWACEVGHQWEMTPSKVKSGSWCSLCRQAEKQQLALQAMQEIAQSRGGACLAEAYINPQTHLRWGCGEGHEWRARPEKIKRGTWCPICAVKLRTDKRRLHKMQDMYALAVERGGTCLSKEFTGVYDKLEWTCARGHVWMAMPAAVQAGRWCWKCYHESRKTSFDEVQGVARSRGGECLSGSYENKETKLLWRCDQGHEWKAQYRSAKKAWCPVCRRRTSSKIGQTVKPVSVDPE